MEKENKFLEYGLDKDAYVAFDALTLKDYIIKRLDDSGQFTDQIYEGSNLAATIDIIAYSYNVLMFYLNNSAAESSFDQATIYENMNKVVKLINYKPTGAQTSIASINAVANNTLPIGNYTIKRNSFFVVDGIQYTTIADYSFDKTTSEQEVIEELNKNMLIYQGSNVEYPTYTAEGEDFELLPIVDLNIVDSTDDRFVADNTISVYVKEIENDTWYEYTEVDSLYLNESKSRVYEKRLNASGNFEIKFGNDSFGRKLSTGDEVAIYYIKSDNTKGIISAKAINGNKLFNYNTSRFTEIFNDVFSAASTTTFIDGANNSEIVFDNPINSSTVAPEESVEQMRLNTPKITASQLRLVSAEDYKSFLLKSIPGILNSVEVISNDRYTKEYLQYFYDICVDPYKHNRVLINQVNFADTCDFNNVNLFCVPTFEQPSDEAYPDFLSTSLKNLVVDMTNDKKIISAEVVPRDPIYMAYSIGFANTDVTLDVIGESTLVVVRESNNKINKNTLKARVENVIRDFFKPSNNKLGQVMDMNRLSSELLSIEGVKSIRTTNSKTNTSFSGVSFLTWNPMYPESDISIVNQNVQLPVFKFPYLYNPTTMSNLISVVDE